MKKILLTGFGAFIDSEVNPTEQLIKDFNGKELGESKIIGKILPVSFSQIEEELRKLGPENYDGVICLGLAAKRDKITPERIAINLKDNLGRPDNLGLEFDKAPIFPGGPSKYFSSLPLNKIEIGLQKLGIPVKLSDTAGSYVCNFTFYCLIKLLVEQKSKIPAGFVHIPHFDRLEGGREDMRRGIEAIIAITTV